MGVWVLSPALALALAFSLYYLFALPLRMVRRSGLLSHLLNWMTIASAGYAAFSLGANNIGNAIGPLANLGFHSGWITLLGGLALASGALTYGHRVTETIASRVVSLDPLSAFTAQTAIVIIAHGFAFVGIPIPLSQAIVGALAGIGLVKGVRTVSYEMLITIGIGWVATPTIAGLLALGLWKLFS